MWQVKEAIDKCVIFLKKKEIPQAEGIWKYNDINNGNNCLIDKSLEIREDNRERSLNKAAGSVTRSDTPWDSTISVLKQVINIHLIVSRWISIHMFTFLGQQKTGENILYILEAH